MIIRPNKPNDLVQFLKSKQLILYGMGDTGIRISNWCDEQGVKYVFADKNFIKLQSCSKKNIISPQSIVNQDADANIVVSSIVYFKEITNDLMQLGIQKERIYSYSMFMPDQVSWEEIEDNRLADWKLMHKRYEMISQWGWIPENVKTVADYGAGRKFIKEYLSEYTKYYPIDFLDRGDCTIFCDFNQEKFPDIDAELSVCTGVLMCIKPARELVTHICKHTKHTVIFSYVTLEGFSDISARRRSSMCNDFTEEQIVEMFLSCKFALKDSKCDRAGNTTMSLYLFEKSGEVK